jgi:hypothetical protein
MYVRCVRATDIQIRKQRPHDMPFQPNNDIKKKYIYKKKIKKERKIEKEREREREREREKTKSLKNAYECIKKR